jgi:GTPase SAR1 family protein
MGCAASQEKGGGDDSGGPREIKVVMLGNGGVGKSAITYRFVHSKFNDTYNPT